MWGRQLCAASTAALIVPSAMVAALVALALGGGFNQLGVLGQIFAGPPASSAGALATATPASRAAARAAGSALPVIPVAQFVASRKVSGGAGRSRLAPVLSAPHRGIGSAGGTIAPGGTATRPVSSGGAGSPAGTPRPPAPAPVSPKPSPSPAPSPSPKPTVVDRAVQVVTSVTSQVPAPVGSTATNAVQAAGRAVGSVLP